MAAYKATRRSHYATYNRGWHARDRTALGDNYIKKILTARSRLRASDIPPVLITAHRALVTAKRILR